MKKIEIHPSTLDLIANCGLAYHYQDNAGSEASKFGTACHEVIFSLAKTGEPNFTSVADKYGLTTDERRELKYLTTGVFEIDFPSDVLLETPLVFPLGDNIILRGTIDVIEPVNGTNLMPIVSDYKFGRREIEPYALQLKAYAVLVTEGGKNDCITRVIQPRAEKVIKEHFFSAEEIQEFVKALQHIGSNIKNKNCCAGSWCDHYYCNHRARCYPYKGEVSIFRSLVLGEKNLIEITPKQLGRMLAMKSTIDSISRNLDKLAKKFVEENGALACGGGLVYRKTEKEQEAIDSLKAYKSLVELKGKDFADSTIKITKSGIREACSKLYKETGEKNLNRLVLDTLRDNKSITTEKKEVYKLIKQPEKLECQT